MILRKKNALTRDGIDWYPRGNNRPDRKRGDSSLIQNGDSSQTDYYPWIENKKVCKQLETGSDFSKSWGSLKERFVKRKK